MRFMNVGNGIRFMGSLPCPAFNAPVDAPANTCLDPVRDYECDLLHTWQLGWLVLSSPTSGHWSARATRLLCARGHEPGDLRSVAAQPLAQELSDVSRLYLLSRSAYPAR